MNIFIVFVLISHFPQAHKLHDSRFDFQKMQIVLPGKQWIILQFWKVRVDSLAEPKKPVLQNTGVLARSVIGVTDSLSQNKLQTKGDPVIMWFEQFNNFYVGLQSWQSSRKIHRKVFKSANMTVFIKFYSAP